METPTVRQVCGPREGDHRGHDYTKWRKVAAVCAVATAARAVAGDTGVDGSLTFPAAYSNHFALALDCLNADGSAPGFKKDIAESRLVLSAARRCLTEPIYITRMADRALEAAAQGMPVSWWQLAREWMDVEPVAARPAIKRMVPRFPTDLAPALADALGTFFTAAAVSRAHLERAFAAVPESERAWAAAYALSGVLDFEDRPADVAAAQAAGMDAVCVRAVVAAGRDLDPAPHSKRFADCVAAVDRAALFAAGEAVVRATRRLVADLKRVRSWPSAPVRLDTPFGQVVVGSPGDDLYRETPFLLIDPGGNDRYLVAVGAANGLQGRPLSVAVDLAGDDIHTSSGLGGTGSALYGVGVVIDVEGNDTYTCGSLGLGAALFGVAWMADEGGADVWRCVRFGQAAAIAGVAVLHDAAGNDAYAAGACAQGYAGPLATAWLVDECGGDTYTVGGDEPDYDRHKEHYISLGQGFATGLRPACGGGIGVLVDLDGNDVYTADVYGQGVSYWYAVGMLLDLQGHDSYRVYEYGQGAGIHLASGLLFDGGGNDTYVGNSLSQGCAHDFASGILIDAEGDDSYLADHFSQGRAINNSFALLLDGAGRDAYFGRQAAECQGIGHFNGERGFGSLSVLMDLGGADRYSDGAADGARRLRPNFGVIYDVLD